MQSQQQGPWMQIQKQATEIVKTRYDIFNDKLGRIEDSGKPAPSQSKAAQKKQIRTGIESIMKAGVQDVFVQYNNRRWQKSEEGLKLEHIQKHLRQMNQQALRLVISADQIPVIKLNQPQIIQVFDENEPMRFIMKVKDLPSPLKLTIQNMDKQPQLARFSNPTQKKNKSEITDLVVEISYSEKKEVVENADNKLKK